MIIFVQEDSEKVIPMDQKGTLDKEHARRVMKRLLGAFGIRHSAILGTIMVV